MLSSVNFQFLHTVAILIGSVTALVDPTEVYNGGFTSASKDPLLRIATGGAGQSGLVKGRAPRLSFQALY